MTAPTTAPDSHRPFDEDRALRLLLEGMGDATGYEFLRNLVHIVSNIFGTNHAWVTELDADASVLRSRAFWFDGRFLDSYEHPLPNTPCEKVIESRRLVLFPDQIIELFPIDDEIKDLGVVSYAGVPMLDAAGEVLGHLAVMDSRPLHLTPRMAAIFELFAVRAASEFQRMRGEERMRHLSQEADLLRDALHELPGAGEIIGDSPAIRKVREHIARVAPTDATVLVLGETGTGKELIARAIHQASRRAHGPLVRVNCAAVPANLMESEFFGHERGAFTGAVARREGRFAAADGGTIFLDEIGEMSPDLQAKLLRVLQEGEFEPLGSNRTRKVDVRVIAATNRDLAGRATAGGFREDLYYRLSVFPLALPPLRERGRDIAALARVFAARYASRMGAPLPTLAETDERLLLSYGWPGNVRELQNVIERALILGSSSRLNLPRAMPAPDDAPSSSAPSGPSAAAFAANQQIILTDQELRELNRTNILRALDAASGRIAGPGGAAELLAITPSTLTSRMKSLGIKRPS